MLATWDDIGTLYYYNPKSTLALKNELPYHPDKINKMERKGKYPFGIGQFEISREDVISKRKSENEDIGTVGLGYFKNVKSLCTTLEKKIPVRLVPNILDLSISVDKQQNFKLVALPIIPLIEAKGLKTLEELTYDFMRESGHDRGLSECPWETALYYVLQRGSQDLNLFHSLSFISEPVVIDGEPSFLSIQRDLSFMYFSSFPIKDCYGYLNDTRDRFVFTQKK